MPRRFKNKQLSHVKEALNQQKAEEAEAIAAEQAEKGEEQPTPTSVADVKKAFKDSAQPEEAVQSVKKQMRKVRKNLRRQNVGQKRTVSWQHEVGDLVQIPSDVRIRSSVHEKLDEDNFGIIVKMTEGDSETRLHDSQSLVFSPSGRNWHYTKTLKKV
jgi:cysteinyl-tRNA synthetase